MPIKDTHADAHQLIAQGFEAIGEALVSLRYADRTTAAGQRLLVLSGKLQGLTGDGAAPAAPTRESRNVCASQASPVPAVVIRSAFPISQSQMVSHLLDGTSVWQTQVFLSPGQELFLELQKACDPRRLSEPTEQSILLVRLSAPRSEAPLATSDDRDGALRAD